LPLINVSTQAILLARCMNIMLLVFVLQFNYYLFGFFFFFCSIGSLGAGNSTDHVSDVIVNRAILLGTTNGVRIKTWQVREFIFAFFGTP
jgi:hypothetical protein